jgi:hypothetical protein
MGVQFSGRGIFIFVQLNHEGRKILHASQFNMFRDFFPGILSIKCETDDVLYLLLKPRMHTALTAFLHVIQSIV